MVNNIRLSVNRTSVVRTHADLFGPEDVGIKMFTYIPDYMNITTTGAFSINTGHRDVLVLQAEHLLAFRRPDDGPREPSVRLRRRRGDVRLEDGVERPLDGADLVQRRRHRPAARRLPARARVRVPGIDAVPAGHQAALFRALRRRTPGGCRRTSRSTTGLRWEPWFPQDSVDQAVYTFDVERMRANTRSTVYPQAPAGLYYPGDPGFPGNSGMKTVWSNIAPRVGVSWDPRGDGRTSLRAGYGLTGDFVTGQFFFDSRSAPPFGLEQRLTNTLLDDPWGAVGRTNPYPVPLGGDDYPYSAALYSLFISMPYRHQDDAQPQLERGVAAAGRRQHGVLGDLPRQPHGQHVGRGRRQPGRDSRRRNGRPARARFDCRPAARRRSPTARRRRSISAAS